MQQPPTRSTAPLFLRVVTPVLKPRKPLKISPAPRNVFILSTGRTGTVYLANLLNQVPDTVSVHEPKPSRVLIAWSAAFFEGRISLDFMSTALASKRKKLLSEIAGSQMYVESNNFIAGFADVLDELFEDAKVIHIVRDPREFTTSLTNRGDDSGLRRFLNRYVPYLAYAPPGVKRRKLTAVTRAAYRWNATNEYLDDFGRRNPNQYYRCKFEDVFDKSNPQPLHELLEQVGLSQEQIDQLDFAAKPHAEQPKFALLDRPDDSANKSKHQIMAKWPAWSQADCKQLDAICGELMKSYGYGNEPEWKNLLR